MRSRFGSSIWSRSLGPNRYNLTVKIPALTGTIKRRVLVNYRADPDVIAALLPAPFRPKLHRGYAMVGICLIRLEHERPSGFPVIVGFGSENAAHRFAVEWTEADGSLSEGVYVPRRDTDSLANRLAGGRLFPVKSHAAHFTGSDSDGHFELSMRSVDRSCEVQVVGDDVDELPQGSCFLSLDEASAFFERGSRGYSPSTGSEGFDAIDLVTPGWRVRALKVSRVYSSYFKDASRFPAGSIEFDHALVMRNLAHEWQAVGQIGGVSSSWVRVSSPVT